jgi:hypothetical protein
MVGHRRKLLIVAALAVMSMVLGVLLFLYGLNLGYEHNQYCNSSPSGTPGC